jgi:hypothetical protein
MENKIDLRTLEEVKSTEIKNVVALNSEGNVIKADLANVINAVNQHTDDFEAVIFEINETNDSVNGIKADLQALEERVDNIPTTGGTGEVTREEFEELDLRVEAHDYRLRDVEDDVERIEDDVKNMFIANKQDNVVDELEDISGGTTVKEFIIAQDFLDAIHYGWQFFRYDGDLYKVLFANERTVIGLSERLTLLHVEYRYEDKVQISKAEITTTPIN